MLSLSSQPQFSALVLNITNVGCGSRETLPERIKVLGFKSSEAFDWTGQAHRLVVVGTRPSRKISKAQALKEDQRLLAALQAYPGLRPLTYARTSTVGTAFKSVRTLLLKAIPAKVLGVNNIFTPLAQQTLPATLEERIAAKEEALTAKKPPKGSAVKAPRSNLVTA